MLERMLLSSWALQEAEVSAFQASAFPPHSRRKAGSGQGVGTSSLLSARRSSWSYLASAEWELTWELPSPPDHCPHPVLGPQPLGWLGEGPVSLLVAKTHRCRSCFPLRTLILPGPPLRPRGLLCPSQPLPHSLLAFSSCQVLPILQPQLSPHVSGMPSCTLGWLSPLSHALAFPSRLVLMVMVNHLWSVH